MPINETAQAKPIAHTAVGWRRIEGRFAGVSTVVGLGSVVVLVMTPWSWCVRVWFGISVALLHLLAELQHDCGRALKRLAILTGELREQRRDPLGH